MVESASFPFLGGIARFVPNARLGGLTDGLDKLRDEFREATLDIDQLEIADQRRRIAEDASRRLQGDLDGFIRESVTTLRQEAARLASDVLATIVAREKARGGVGFEFFAPHGALFATAWQAAGEDVEFSVAG